MAVKYKLEAQCGEARAGLISTPNGEIQTPAFMLKSTQSTVKAMTYDQVEACGTEIGLAILITFICAQELI